jgi:hypothetical protein
VAVSRSNCTRKRFSADQHKANKKGVLGDSSRISGEVAGQNWWCERIGLLLSNRQEKTLLISNVVGGWLSTRL